MMAPIISMSASGSHLLNTLTSVIMSTNIRLTLRQCDESRPSCKNCVRHSYDCDFASIPSSQAVPTVSLPGSGSSRLSNSPSTWPQSNPSPVNHRVTLVDVIPAQPFSLNLIDLELLHNFSTSTSQTISNEPIIRTLWRINVPQLGFQHEFVMRSVFSETSKPIAALLTHRRGILAMSALHMAQFHPHKAEFYVSHSLAHQQIGLQIVSGILPNINEENCSAIYIFSAMIAMCALAGPRRPDDLLVGTDVDNGASEWLHLFRGVRSIIDSAYPTLSSGTLGPMFQAGARRFLLREIEPIDDSNLQELRRLIQRTVHESDAKQAYLSAVDTLQVSSLSCHFMQ